LLSRLTLSVGLVMAQFDIFLNASSNTQLELISKVKQFIGGVVPQILRVRERSMNLSG
jgi:hypothetical protein